MSEHTQNLSSCCALCGIKNDKKNLQSYKFSTNANKFKEIIRDERDFEVEKPKNFCYSCRKLMGNLNKRINNPDEMIKVCDDLRSVKHQFDPHSPQCFVCRQFQAAPGAPAAVVGPAPCPAPCPAPADSPSTSAATALPPPPPPPLPPDSPSCVPPSTPPPRLEAEDVSDNEMEVEEAPNSVAGFLANLTPEQVTPSDYDRQRTSIQPHTPEVRVHSRGENKKLFLYKEGSQEPTEILAGNSSLGHEHFVGINLEDHFQCVMCDKVTFDPRVTSCGHIYCHPCLLALQQETTACWLHLHQDNNALIKIRILMTVPNFLLNWNGLVEWRY